MEIKINKEIRTYRENVFFGLNLRQFACSAVAAGAAVGVFFAFRDTLGQESVSWVCMLAAAPFAVAGFFRYQGMALERFAVAWLRSEFLCAGRRRYKARNYFAEAVREAIKMK